MSAIAFWAVSNILHEFRVFFYFFMARNIRPKTLAVFKNAPTAHSKSLLSSVVKGFNGKCRPNKPHS